MKKIGKIIGSLLVSSLLLAGCNSEKEIQKPFTPKEELKVTNEFVTLSNNTQDGSPTIYMEKLDKVIGRMSKENANHSVDALLYNIYQHSSSISKLVSDKQDVLRSYGEQQDLTKVNAYQTVNNNEVKNVLKTLNDNGFVLAKNGTSYTIKPDVLRVKQKYGQYVNSDLNDYLGFSVQEYQTNFFDYQKNMFDLDLVTKRIVFLEKMITKHKGSYYQPAFQSSKDYYYQTYFGLNSPFIIQNDRTVLPEVVKHYNETIKKYPNSQLAKDVKTYLAVLDKDHGKVTDNTFEKLLELSKAQKDFSKTLTKSFKDRAK